MFRLYGHQQQQQQHQQYCSMSGNSNGEVYIVPTPRCEQAKAHCIHQDARARRRSLDGCSFKSASVCCRKVFYMLKLENEANFGSYTRIRTRILAGAFLSFAGFNSGSSSKFLYSTPKF
uniref:Uncharacterized protein n=1 Tax=Trichogramma kaykai TaxID=54128 RepID=A0ABD2WKX7_9HYME